jgi:uncharacterized repeat protein (TIGR04138 family)
LDDQQVIQINLVCRKCRYNLRGLPVGNRCPECGEPAPDGVSNRDDLRRWRQRRAFGQTADAIGCSLDALLFVTDSFRTAKAAAGRTAFGNARSVSAEALCNAFGDLAREYFNDEAEAIELLSEWGIKCSEDLGRIVFGLVKRGMLRESGDDSEKDFEGRFTLETIFHASK